MHKLNKGDIVVLGEDVGFIASLTVLRFEKIGYFILQNSILKCHLFHYTKNTSQEVADARRNTAYPTYVELRDMHAFEKKLFIKNLLLRQRVSLEERAKFFKNHYGINDSRYMINMILAEYRLLKNYFSDPLQPLRIG